MAADLESTTYEYTRTTQNGMRVSGGTAAAGGQPSSESELFEEQLEFAGGNAAT